MLRLSCLLIATLIVQVYSFDGCSDKECYFKESFENCENFDFCQQDPSNYETILKHYNVAYNYQEAKQQDEISPALNGLFNAFNAKVEKGTRRCRNFLDYHVGNICDSELHSFYYYYDPEEDRDLADVCTDFAEAMKTQCAEAKQKLVTCDVKATFEEKVEKEWNKCINYENIE